MTEEVIAQYEQAYSINLLRRECWAISENGDEPLPELVRLFEDCISEHPDSEELTESFWVRGSQAGWGRLPTAEDRIAALEEQLAELTELIIDLTEALQAN